MDHNQMKPKHISRRTFVTGMSVTGVSLLAGIANGSRIEAVGLDKETDSTVQKEGKKLGHFEDALYIMDASGLNQQQVNDGLESIADLLAITDPKEGARQYVKSYYTGQNKGGKFYVYSASKKNVNDGGRILNGWVAQKDLLDIHDFGLHPYTGSDWSSIADYNLKNPWYVPASVYNNYISSCNLNKQSAYFPAGDYVLEDGQYALPTYGLKGDDKDSTRIFTALIQAGKIFTYNNINTYDVGHSKFMDNLTVYTHRTNHSCEVLTVYTPTRGAKVSDVNFYSSGEIISYYDVWYMKWDNCGFYGYFRSGGATQADPYTAVAITNKNNKENNNTHYEKCSFLDLKGVVRGRKAGYTTSGIGILFTNSSFERIGECAFDLLYLNTTFDTCHFEQLGMHHGFMTPANDFDRTILMYGGENTIVLKGTGNIWVGGKSPNLASYSIFNSEGRCLVHLGAYRMTKNSRPLLKLSGTVFGIRYCTVLSQEVVNTEASYVNPLHLHFTNTGSTYRTYEHIAIPLKANEEKAKTTYASLNRDPGGLINATAANRSCATVTVRMYDKPVIAKTSGRLYRVGGTATYCVQYVEFDATWVITPDTPDIAILVSLDCSLKGTKVDGTTNLDPYTSLFGTLDVDVLKSGFKFVRKTAANNGNVSPFDVTYAMTYSGTYSGYWATTGGYHSIFDVKTDIVFAEDPISAKVNFAYINPNVNSST